MPILGTLATVASLTIIMIGLPAQIVRNYRRKHCDISPSLVFSAVCSYTLWSLYGWTKPDWYLATALTPGSLLAIVLLVQLIYYGQEESRNGRP